MKSLSTAHWGRRKADFSFVGFASSSPLCSSASSRGWASSWRTKARTQFYEDLSARPLSGFFLRRFSGLSSSFNQCTSTLKRSLNLEKEVKRPYAKGVSASASTYHFTPHAEMSNNLTVITAYNPERPVVALVGLPNCGKSTMFNRMVGMNKSLVTPTAGTTRDRVYSDFLLDGRPVMV